MDWIEYQATLTHLSEERVGKVVREVRRLEDAEFAASAKKLR